MKIEEQVLSREQMAHLKALGIDTSDASMMWVLVLNKESEEWAIYINNSIMKSIASMSDDGAKRFIPTYTIGDLEEKLPKIIGSKELKTHFGIKNVGYWTLAEGLHSVNYKRYIDGLYNLLCWVTRNHKELIK